MSGRRLAAAQVVSKRGDVGENVTRHLELELDFERFEDAIAGLSQLLLMLQGDGDYEGAKELTEGKGIIGPDLQGDLDRLTEANIPVDITFRQGVEELGIDQES